MKTQPPSVALDADRRRVTIGKRCAKLTRLEFDVFVLLRDAKRVMSREEIASRIHGSGWRKRLGIRAIDQHVARIRRKLDRADVIETMVYSGYVYNGA